MRQIQLLASFDDPRDATQRNVLGWDIERQSYVVYNGVRLKSITRVIGITNEERVEIPGGQEWTEPLPWMLGCAGQQKLVLKIAAVDGEPDVEIPTPASTEK